MCIPRDRHIVEDGYRCDFRAVSLEITVETPAAAAATTAETAFNVFSVRLEQVITQNNGSFCQKTF